MKLLGWVCTLCAATLAAAASPVSDIRQDQEVLLFPATAYQPRGSTEWELEIKGCVFEPEQRRWAAAAISRALRLKGVRLTEREELMLKERVRTFARDNEGGRAIVLRVGDRLVRCGRSNRDGTFSGKVLLPDSEIQKLVPRVVTVVLPSDDRRVFSGPFFLLPNTGLTVISDIDDTIKVSCVLDRTAMLRKTFLEPFAAVEGMAHLYTSWATNLDAQFVYVSASPWQLFAPLSGFAATNGFPAGIFSLKTVRWTDRSLFDLVGDPETHKRKAIEPLLRRFPERRFVLVGDSGERDPEIYGRLARRFPKQVQAIYIRDITGEPADCARYTDAFAELPAGIWRVFADPKGLHGLLQP